MFANVSRVHTRKMVAPYPCHSGVPGVLRPYGSNRLVAFDFGDAVAARQSVLDPSCTRSCEDFRVAVFLGGLTDGLLGVPYFQSLATKLKRLGFAHVLQPVLRSSYMGFGYGSLDQDVADLVELIRDVSVGGVDRPDALVEGARPISELLIVGHSTGAQDIVRFLTSDHARESLFAGPSARVRSVVGVLQGAVSDREALVVEGRDLKEVDRWLREAGQMCARKPVALVNTTEGNGILDTTEKSKSFYAGRGAVMPPAACEIAGCPAITAERFLSLFGRCTADDAFSSDLCDAELGEHYGKLKDLFALGVPVRLHFVQSAEDEYVGLSRAEYEAFMARLCGVINGISAKADQSLSIVASAFFHRGSHNCAGNSAEVEDEILRLLVEASEATSMAFGGAISGAVPPGEVPRPVVRSIPDYVLGLAQRIRGASFEESVARAALDCSSDRRVTKPLLIAIAGIPGAGKSTCGRMLARLLDTEVLGMDGFHFPLAKLRMFADPDEAVYFSEFGFSYSY